MRYGELYNAPRQPLFSMPLIVCRSAPGSSGSIFASGQELLSCRGAALSDFVEAGLSERFWAVSAVKRTEPQMSRPISARGRYRPLGRPPGPDTAGRHGRTMADINYRPPERV